MKKYRRYVPQHSLKGKKKAVAHFKTIFSYRYATFRRWSNKIFRTYCLLCAHTTSASVLLRAINYLNTSRKQVATLQQITPVTKQQCIVTARAVRRTQSKCLLRSS